MPQPTFNIIFATSSDFTLPILQSILDNQGKTLLSVALEQLNDLEKNLEIKPSPNFENNLLHNYLENIKAKLLEYQNNKHLENLHKPIKVVAVITQPDRENRGKIILNPISTFAVSRNLELFTPLRLNLEQEKLARFSPDIVIVASFGQIISTKILAIPTHGFINWHPSLLPLYRGAVPMQQAIADSQTQTGLSWIDMTRELDAGQIYLQISTILNPQTTFAQLAVQMGDLGASTWAIAMIAKVLDIGKVQDETKATTFNRVDKDFRLIIPTKITAKQVCDQWRGYSIFPGVYFYDDYFAAEVKLLEIENDDLKVSGLASDSFRIISNWLLFKNSKVQKVYLICKDASLLRVHKIRLTGGKTIDFSGFQFLPVDNKTNLN